MSAYPTEDKYGNACEAAAQQCQTGCPAPKGALEYAQERSKSLGVHYYELIEDEIIRAREMGQREGTEEEARRYKSLVKQLEAQIEQLHKSLLWAQQTAMKPVFIYASSDAEAHLQKLNDTQVKTIGNMRKDICDLEKKLEIAVAEISTLQRRNDNQYDLITQLRKASDEAVHLLHHV